MAVASQNKRKTNHEPYEEDRNKLAIGYRLSAIGYRLILGVLVSIFALQAQSACYFFDEFVDNKDGTVTDPRDGLLWKRCAEGSEFNGTRCSEAGVYVTWFDAMTIAKNSNFLGKNDWRLPTKTEMQAVNGRSGCEKNDDKHAFSASNMITHVTRNGYPGNFWSSSPVEGEPSYVWKVYFGSGNADRDIRHNSDHVRLVRSSKSLDNKVSSEFDRENAKTSGYKALIKEHDAKANHPSNRSPQPTRGMQLCEAQKRTCFASCPVWRSGINNDIHFSCNRNCESISCN